MCRYLLMSKYKDANTITIEYEQNSNMKLFIRNLICVFSVLNNRLCNRKIEIKRKTQDDVKQRKKMRKKKIS